MRNLVGVFSMVFALMLISANASASLYEFTGYSSSLDLTDETITYNATSYADTCQYQGSATGTFTTSTEFDTSLAWRAPDGTIIGSTNLEDIGNTTCVNYGTTSLKDISREPTNLFFESSRTLTHGADSGYVTVGSKYVCETSGSITNFTLNRGVDDSRGNCIWAVAQANGLNQNNWINGIISNHTTCGNMELWEKTKSCGDYTTALAAQDVTTQYIYPFNSSFTGNVNYSFTDALMSISSTGGTTVTTYTISLIDVEGEDTTTLYTQNANLASGGSHNPPDQTGSLSLKPNRMYVIAVTWSLDYPLGQQAQVADIRVPETQLSILTFQPNYVCGSFGECSGGIKTRTCVDSNGVVPDLIESLACFDVPDVELDLGFEDFMEQNVYICAPDFACIKTINTIGVRYPVNWTVIGTEIGGANLENFVQISQDTATVGSSSLKMWSIPSKDDEPINVAGAAQCGNQTTGRFPEITHPYNETMFITQNVTFENPFVQLRFDVRKCDTPVVQYDYTDSLFGVCGEKCYARNCSDEIGGRFGVRISRVSTEIIPRGDDFSFNFFNETGGDVTNSVINSTGTVAVDIKQDTGENPYINLTNGTVQEFMSIRILGNPAGADVGKKILLQNANRTVTFGTATILESGEHWINTTLNVTGVYPDTIINMSDEFDGADVDITIRTIQILIPEREIVASVTRLGDLYEEATNQWESVTIDLSNADVETGVDYQISMAVNPENVYDPISHCIYFDNFRATFTDTALPDCESSCEGLKRIEARLQGRACIFSEIEVSPLCAITEELKNEIESILLGNEVDNSTCFEGNLYSYDPDTGEWETVDDSEICDQVTTTAIANATSTRTTNEMIEETVNLFFSLFFIAMVIVIGTVIGVSIKAESWEAGVICGVIEIITFTVFGWIPVEIGIFIVLAVAAIWAVIARKILS